MCHGCAVSELIQTRQSLKIIHPKINAILIFATARAFYWIICRRAYNTSSASLDMIITDTYRDATTIYLFNFTLKQDLYLTC